MCEPIGVKAPTEVNEAKEAREAALEEMYETRERAHYGLRILELGMGKVSEGTFDAAEKVVRDYLEKATKKI